MLGTGAENTGEGNNDAAGAEYPNNPVPNPPNPKPPPPMAAWTGLGGYTPNTSYSRSLFLQNYLTMLK